MITNDEYSRFGQVAHLNNHQSNLRLPQSNSLILLPLYLPWNLDLRFPVVRALSKRSIISCPITARIRSGTAVYCKDTAAPRRL